MESVRNLLSRPSDGVSREAPARLPARGLHALCARLSRRTAGNLPESGQVGKARPGQAISYDQVSRISFRERENSDRPLPSRVFFLLLDAGRSSSDAWIIRERTSSCIWRAHGYAQR